jgi:hypothetical protein
MSGLLFGKNNTATARFERKLYDSDEEDYSRLPLKKFKSETEEDTNFITEYKTLKNLIYRMFDACEYNYVLVTINWDPINMRLDYTHRTSKISEFFENHSDKLFGMDHAVDLNEEKDGFDSKNVDMDRCDYINNKKQRKEFYKKTIDTIEHVLDSSKHIRSYFLLVVNEENSFITMSDFFKKFYLIYKNKIEESLKLFIK